MSETKNARTITGSTVQFPILEPRLIYGLVVTAELATWFLEFSKEKFNNRNTNQDRVRQYGEDMAAGRWKHNGETLKFNEEGVLVDGYTRCAAAFAYDATFVTDIRTCVPEDAVSTIDTGRARSLGNALAMAGMAEKAPAALAQGINWLYRYCTGTVGERWRRISHGDSMEFLKQHPGLHESVSATSQVRNKNLASPGVLVAAHYICHVACPKKAPEFFECLGTGVGLTQLSPIRHLREKLLSRTERRARAEEQLAWILHAWNKHIAGEQVRVFKVPNEIPTVKGFERQQEKKAAMAS
jgi:hypothetical protein